MQHKRSDSSSSLERAVTMQDIADYCGVHLMTVSRALRQDRGNVSEKTIQRIHAAAAQLGYDPSRNDFVRRMVQRSHGQRVVNQALALFYPPQFQQDVYASRLMSGLVSVLEPRFYALVLVHTYARYVTPAMTHDLPPILKRGEVDGAVALAGHIPFAETVALLRKEPHFRNRPIISLMQPFAGCSTFRSDDFAGAREATKHLLDLGHRHVLCFLSDPADFRRNEQLRGFRQAFADAGLHADRYLHVQPYSSPGPPAERLTQPLWQALAAHPEITAIFAPNDGYAIILYHLLRDRGIRVPEDMSLVGFDGTYLAIDDPRVSFLTSVRLPLEEIGRRAAEYLVQCVTDDCEDITTEVFPVELLVNHSTGPCRRAKG
ncbi:MAG TPA: LacI family DNA-binding transcriptional regulator [Armatimonadota bacterium]|jgi:DNA-binding LacI/PurR family transcriptional regulator